MTLTQRNSVTPRRWLDQASAYTMEDRAQFTHAYSATQNSVLLFPRHSSWTRASGLRTFTNWRDFFLSLRTKRSAPNGLPSSSATRNDLLTMSRQRWGLQSVPMRCLMSRSRYVFYGRMCCCESPLNVSLSSVSTSTRYTQRRYSPSMITNAVSFQRQTLNILGVIHVSLIFFAAELINDGSFSVTSRSSR